MTFYCIDLSMLNEGDMNQLINQRKLPFGVELLSSMKRDGYRKLYFSNDDHILCFYIINNDDTLHVANTLKNDVIDINNGVYKKKSQSSYFSRFTEDEIISERSRLSSKVNLLGKESLSNDENEFWKIYID